MAALRRDPWLSVILGVNAFRLKDVAKLANGDLGESDVDFAWVKIPAVDGPSCSRLQELGFRVVEGSLTLEQMPRPEAVLVGNVREACPEDEEAVTRIAGRTFEHDRFHQDPLINVEAADALKSEWARNYFQGARGDRMLVHELDGVIAGFLLAIESEPSGVVIDLIGTAPEFRGQGVASKLLAFLADSTVGRVRVGTQFSNLPSLRLYVRHGFVPVKAEWTMHFHRKQST